jgi:hypothetical protein
MKTFNIISADIITKKGEVPFVGLTIDLNGKEVQVSRSLKQMLLELHKSNRASHIPASLFENGVDKANYQLYNKFATCVRGLTGKSGFGDLNCYNAGDEYEATEHSSAVKDSKAKVGDILRYEKAGTRVETGFLIFTGNINPQELLETVDQAFIANALIAGITGIAIPTNVKPVLELPASNNRRGLDIVENDEELKAIREKENAEAFGEFSAEDFATGEPAANSKPSKK